MIPHILRARVDMPHALHPAKAAQILHALAGRESIPLQITGNIRADLSDEIDMAAIAQANADKIYTTSGGVMVVPVKDTLIKESGSFRPQSGSTGYDGILTALRTAESQFAEGKIRGTAFSIRSGGGEVSGLFSLADRIGASMMPTLAIVDDYAYSAAYAIASQCDEIVLAPYTGSVGSVGVIMTHIDHEAYLANEGLKVTMIHAGARKTDGNPYEALPPEVRERYQAEVDRLHGEFVRLVSEGRGMTAEAVRATEADTFDLQAAVDVGFADRIADPMDALAEFSERLARASVPNPSTNGGNPMTDTARASGTADAALDAQASAQAVADARAAGKAEGIKEERAKHAAIMALPEAKGREAAASEMIAEGTSPALAAKLLAMIPVAGAEAPEKQAGASDEMDKIQAAAAKGASAAIAAMMDTAEGTGIEAVPDVGTAEGGAEKFAAAVMQ